jgi:cytochrome b pre-mRNA-processing protein 3
MKFRPFQRASQTRSIAPLYGAIVAQARAPAFYRVYGVPDTVNGRLEMIMLHAVLLLARLETESAPIREAGQRLFDDFCRDMDASMREMGVGDLAVPKKMRRIADAFFGRQSAYRAALAEPGEQPLAAALARNVFAGSTEPHGPAQLAAYVREAARRLADQKLEGLQSAELAFPDPERLAAI